MSQSAISNSKGMTLIELIVALALGIVIVVLAASSLQSINKIHSKVSVQVIENKQMNLILKNVRKGLAQHQIQYKLNTQYGVDKEKLQRDNLYYAWDKSIVTEKENCKTCPGRMGYVISPHPTLKGMYVAYLRFTHKDWGDDVVKEYSFVLTGL